MALQHMILLLGLHCFTMAAGLASTQDVAACSAGSGNRSSTAALASELQAALGFPQRVLTSSSAPLAYGTALQGYYAPGDPQAYGAMPAMVVQPQSETWQALDVYAHACARCHIIHGATSRNLHELSLTQ